MIYLILYTVIRKISNDTRNERHISYKGQ